MSTIFYKDNPYGGTTTVTDAGHVLVTQGSDTVTAQAKFNTQTTAIQRILGNFATVEESTTASKAYNVGDYLVLNSFLYKVTYPIAAGGTIDNTQNGNVVKTTAGKEFGNGEGGTGGWEAENSVYDNTESGLTATNVQDALDEVNSNLSKAFKIKYQSTNWATLHSFPVESVPRIGLILTHDGTLYSFAQYNTGNIDIQKIAGGHTITKSVASDYNRLQVDASVGLIVLVSQ